MVFSSLVFLFAYLAVTLVIYYAVPRKARNIFLFFINLLFYGWGEPMLVFLMVFNIFFNYLGGYLVDKFRSDRKKKKLFLILTCALDIGILAVFKYTGLIVDTVNLLPFLNIPTVQISLPIGISFYTFQTMSYVIDVYRNDAPVSRSFINFGTYVALFPQLIAGPIVRYRDVAYQLEHRRETLDRFTKGVKLFCVGLGKKVLIANQMGALTSAMFSNTEENGVLGWFKEYVYIPLGGNRKGVRRQIINLLIVWGLTGLWHGASYNFIFWGLYYGLLLILEKFVLSRFLDKLPAVLRHVYTLFIVMIGWGLFYFTDVNQLFAFLGDLFNFGNGVFSETALNLTLSYLPVLVVAGLASTPLGAHLYSKVSQRKYVWIAETVFCAVVLFVSTASLVQQSYNPFLYFRF